MNYNFFVLLCSLCLIQPQHIWLLFDNDKLIREKRAISFEHFTEHHLANVWLQLRDYSQFVPYARGIYSPDLRLLDYVEKGTLVMSADSYFFRLREEFPDGLRTWRRLAMVLKIGSTGILRIRENGRIKEILLTPQHPPPGQDLGYEVLDFSGNLCGPRKYCGLSVYVRKVRGAIRQEDLEAIGRRFCEVDPTLEYLIYARPDSWFIEHPDFPFLYAFDEGYRLPHPKTWQQDRQEWSITQVCSPSSVAKEDQ